MSSKIGILKSEGNGETKNIGDYIQALAAMQFVPKGADTILLDREHLDTFGLGDGQKVRTIMNAWFMSKPQNFPPSSSILPLYVSFHLTPAAEKQFFTKDTIDHLKRHEPIGCRDTNTRELMIKYGIDAYFSGCLTLTLGNTYSHKPCVNSLVYIVDLYCENFFDWDIFTSIRQIVRVTYYSMVKRKLIQRISQQIAKTTYGYSAKTSRFLYAARLYSTYSGVLDDETLATAVYLEHRIPVHLIPTDDLRFEYARQLLKKYESAKLVVTSRIHCALPCLGMGTPVLFAYSKKMERKFRPTRPNGRLGGLLDLFNCIEIRYGIGKFEKTSRSKKQVDTGDVFTNKNTCLKYISDLSQKVSSFINCY